MLANHTLLPGTSENESYALLFSKSEYQIEIIQKGVCVLNKVNDGLKTSAKMIKGLQIVFLDQKHLTP